MNDPVPLLHDYLIHSAHRDGAKIALMCDGHRVTYGQLEAWSNAVAHHLVAAGVERGDRVMPVHQGVAGLTLHLFTRGEAAGLLRGAGLRIVAVWPLSLRPDGRLPAPWWLGRLRAYGYLLAAERP